MRRPDKFINIKYGTIGVGSVLITYWQEPSTNTLDLITETVHLLISKVQARTHIETGREITMSMIGN